MKSLLEFSAELDAAEKRTRCKVCGLDHKVLVQIHDARAATPRVTYRRISDWLARELGHEISASNLRDHFAARHNLGDH